MPTWDFICDCSHTERNVSSSYCDVERVRPQHCGKPMEVLWDNSQLGTNVFQAYDTTHIDPDGKKLHIGSRKELARLENEHGLTRIDDPDLEMRGGKLFKKSKASAGCVYFT